MLKKKLLATVVLALSATAVQADEVSGYVTGSLGQAKVEKPKFAKELQSTFDELGGRTSTDRTDTAYKIAVGLKVNPYVALEAQYIDLGDASYKGSHSQAELDGSSLALSGKVKSSTSGFGGNLVATYPIEDFTLFAKVGYHYLESKGKAAAQAKISMPSYNINESTSVSDSVTVRKWAPSFGLGASYNITQVLAVVAEYERYKGVADKKYNTEVGTISMKHDIDFASVGLRYSF